jgi:hypothetical protein
VKNQRCNACTESALRKTVSWSLPRLLHVCSRIKRKIMKKQILSLGLMLLSGVAMAQIPETGLIAYYPLGMEHSLSNPFPVTHYDLSGNNYDLAVSNGFGWGPGRTGQSGEAAEFNNISGDSRTFDYSNAQAAFKQTGNFTISVWVRLGSPYLNEYQSICVLGDNDIFLRFRHDGTGNYFIQGGYRTGVSSYAVLNQVVNTDDYFNTWKLITLRRTGSQLQIFSNSTQVSTNIFTTNPSVHTAGANNLYLGSAAGTYTLKGRLQDFFYYNRSISTQELDQLICSAPNPVDNGSTPYQNICTGTTVWLNAIASPNTNPINWYTSQLGGTSILTGSILGLGAVTSNVNYYVDATASNGCVSYPRKKYEVTVTSTLETAPVNTTPAQNLSICSGSTTSLSVSGTAVTWYAASSGGSSLGSGTSFTTPQLTGNTTYYAQSGTGACASVRTAIAIVVDAPPAAPVITTSTTACGTQVSPLQGTASGPISWYDVPNGGTSLGTGLTYTPAHPNPAGPGQTLQATYYGETVSACGVASARTPINITINYFHAAPVITTPIEQLTICPGATATLSATSTGSLTWSGADFPWPVLGSGNSVTTPPLTTTTGYSVAQTPGGCGANTIVTVTVLPSVPSAPTNTTVSASICSGTAATLTATGTGTLNWYDAATGGSSLGTGGSFTTPTLSGNTTYHVESAEGSCASTRTAVEVTVNPIPSAPTNTTVAGSLSVCAGETTTLTATGSGTLNWYAAPTGGSSLGTGGSFTTPTLSSNTTYYVSSTQSGCTSARTAVAVTVNAIPNAPANTTAAGSLSVCDGETTSLTATGSGTLNWYAAPTGGSSLGTGVSFTTPTLSGNTTYYVSSTQSGCASARTGVAVTVNQPTTGIDVRTACDELLWIDGNTYTASNTTATFVLTNAAGCDSTVTLNLTIDALPDLNITLDNGVLEADEANATYQWVDCDNGNAPIADANVQSFTPTVSGNYAVQLSYGNGCTVVSSCTAVTVIPVSINDMTAQSWTMFPNPANGQVTLDGLTAGSTITLMDAMGRTVSSTAVTAARMEVSVAALSSGIYMVQVMDGNEVRTARLMVN